MVVGNFVVVIVVAVVNLAVDIGMIAISDNRDQTGA